jgi:hypothetical protein
LEAQKLLHVGRKNDVFQKYLQVAQRPKPRDKMSHSDFSQGREFDSRKGYTQKRWVCQRALPRKVRGALRFEINCDRLLTFDSYRPRPPNQMLLRDDERTTLRSENVAEVVQA